MTEYIIVGDTAEHTGCLMLTGFTAREPAEDTIKDMLRNPGDYYRVKDHHNIRVQEVSDSEAWWNHDRLD